jgi:hypothetical protein
LPVSLSSIRIVFTALPSSKEMSCLRIVVALLRGDELVALGGVETSIFTGGDFHSVSGILDLLVDFWPTMLTLRLP